ncbi:hypothetical protein [Lachnoclostridium sp. An138]|uniref:hypothetical protein n=1 Tax=Lachnoclostridium sp. An138 TaxID=1965560 RepID=UPI000B368679|nr:hypothetical protein [Lachnoclostridium sp. An138]OUQ20347.1 hypothetical protein B5E82_02480 [Lachnoclostridium sp. An138]
MVEEVEAGRVEVIAIKGMSRLGHDYDVGNVLDIPLTYQKDMLVYNTDKITGYTFTGTPCFFDILSLESAE